MSPINKIGSSPVLVRINSRQARSVFRRRPGTKDHQAVCPRDDL